MDDVAKGAAGSEAPDSVYCMLYHETCRGGRVFTTQAELEAAVADGWVDSPTSLPAKKRATKKAATKNADGE